MRFIIYYIILLALVAWLQFLLAFKKFTQNYYYAENEATLQSIRDRFRTTI